MKIAIVHDWLTNFGGAEKVVLKLHEMFPEAPIYTLVYNKKNMEKYFKGIDIKTSFIQKLPFGVKLYKYYLPLMPRAIEQFNLNDYDVVISSSSCCAKGVNVNANTVHICYCHTPMRYAWDMYWEYNKGNKMKRRIIARIMHKMRIWDYVSSGRVDYFIANSSNVARRIKKHYRRQAEVVYPPIDSEYYKVNNYKKGKDFYLLVTRLVPYKRADIIVQAFNELELPLIIVGSGTEEKKLKKIAKENISFVKNVRKEKLKWYYDNAKAFVFMAEEDFGMVMAEAQACGKPVVAYYKGGASEIVNENTGILIHKQDKETLKQAILQIENGDMRFDEKAIRNNAKKFNEIHFRERNQSYCRRGNCK